MFQILQQHMPYTEWRPRVCLAGQRHTVAQFPAIQPDGAAECHMQALHDGICQHDLAYFIIMCCASRSPVYTDCAAAIHV